MIDFAPPGLRLRHSTLVLGILLLTGCAATLKHRSGLSLMEDGRYDEAVQQLQEAMTLDPSDPRFRMDYLSQRDEANRRFLALADRAIQAGELEAAEAYFKMIQRYDPANVRARAGLDEVLRQRQGDEALAQAKEFWKQGDRERAALLINRALDVRPTMAEARALKREMDELQAKELLSVPTLGSLYRKPINLEFRDASVKAVFEALSRTTGINFIFDRDVRADQRTTVFLKQTTLEDAIDVILATNQLDKKILNASSVLIYPNNAAKSKEYQDLMVKAFYLSHADAKQSANLLKTVLKLKDVFVDDKLNMLVLRETPETLALAEKLIALQDLDEPEVMLEVEVLEINRSDLLDLGLSLTNKFEISPLNSISGSGDSQRIKIKDLENINSSQIGITLPSATLSFLKTKGNANLLANPRIRVRDGEKAKIMIGDKIPVINTTTSTSNTGFVSENVQYVDVGLKLDVEPSVYLRDEVGLKINLEVSSLGAATITKSGTTAYQIGTRSASSVLKLKDGETQVLAGLISDSDRSSGNGLPLLGDLPIVGRLFSGHKDERQKTEIVLSITPRLVRSTQRKEPAAETFWSGTEAVLRSKSLQLRSMEQTQIVPANRNPAAALPAANTATAASKVTPAVSPAPATAASPVTDQPTAVGNSPFKLQWLGSSQAKVGTPVVLELSLDTPDAVRAVPLQIAYNPAQFEVISVQEGDFFNRAGGKPSFSHVLDKASGRISIGMASDQANGGKGAGKLLSLQLRPLQASSSAEITVIGATPIGSIGAVPRPDLPLLHRMTIE